jgi:hypothetical protein
MVELGSCWGQSLSQALQTERAVTGAGEGGRTQRVVGLHLTLPGSVHGW